MINEEQEIFTFHILKRIDDKEEINSDKLNIMNLVKYSPNVFYTTDMMQIELKLKVENPKVSKYINGDKKYDGYYDIILRNATYWQKFNNMKINKIELQKDKGCIIYFVKDISENNYIQCVSNKGYEDKLTIGILYPVLDYNKNWTTILNNYMDDESYPSEFFTRLNY